MIMVAQIPCDPARMQQSLDSAAKMVGGSSSQANKQAAYARVGHNLTLLDIDAINDQDSFKIVNKI
jgi:hypothetical protein